MVATKLSEVAGKGWGWYSSSDQVSSSPSRPSATSSNPSKGSAFASQQTCRDPSSLLSTPKRHRSDSDVDTVTPAAPVSHYKAAQESVADTLFSLFTPTTAEKSSEGNLDAASLEDTPSTTSSSNGRSAGAGRRASLGITDWNSSLLLSPTLLKLFHNPYISVRGPGRQDRAKPQQSMEAVRNLIYVVPIDDTKSDHDSDDDLILGVSFPKIRKEGRSSSAVPSFWSSMFSRSGWNRHPPPSGSLPLGATRNDETFSNHPGGTNPSSPEETASQLAEGTLRALIEKSLDESVELHSSLRYWTERYERPLLSFVEAGPMVWFSSEGYNHQIVGQKVSQIQAVLARRLSTIGELQHHLLKSGWQRGVAQWGFLGEGGEWAAISGTDGRMDDEGDGYSRRCSSIVSFRGEQETSLTDPPLSEPYTLKRRTSDQLLHYPTPVRHELPVPAPTSKTSNLPQRSQHHNQLYYTNLFVKKNDGGHILVDSTALAEWSIDAIFLVRKQLFRAANGKRSLPFSENWMNDSILGEERATSPSFNEHCPVASDAAVEVSESGESTLPYGRTALVPKWASTMSNKVDGVQTGTKVSDLPLLVEEVSSLLDVMEEIMGIQRARRLEKLKPPSWWRQNWFLTSVCAPLACYGCYSISVRGNGLDVIRFMSKKVADFFQEHVVRPCLAIYHELTKGTEYFSDRAARETAIQTLKKMIRSWLDETYPDMLEKDREELSEAMDMSLIEVTKERSMKTIYELNSVLRMSFIEAQFIKKEMMNALVALDEMQASTNFNMNLAAITPFVLLVWSVKKVSSFIFYTTFKWGKSRAVTYASFLHILTEIERLLIMRFNPPNTSPNSSCILDSDDLGMLMLHLHELRTLMWNERRRFSFDIIRSVSEDLAELSGERGAVSVQQQLYIVERMSRTYAFLKNAGSKE